MTNLEITPKWRDKSAKFKGTVAAGEHVRVTIANDGYVSGATNLRLRVIGARGEALAQFPLEDGDAWEADITPLECTLNLNTVQMLQAVASGVETPLLWVLDDAVSNTLYFKEFHRVAHWPRRTGEDEPVDLSGYADFVAEVKEGLESAQAAVESATQAANTAREAAASAVQALEDATSDVRRSAAAAQAAQAAAESAAADVEMRLADYLPKTDVVAPDEEAVAGQAAGAVAVREALAGKVDTSEIERALDDILADSGDSTYTPGLYAKNKATGLYHEVVVVADPATGQQVLGVEQTGVEK